MSFLRGLASPETTRSLTGESVHLRAPLPQDYAAWAALRAQSRTFLQPWEPLWARDELTRSAFRRRLRRYQREMRADKAYPFFVFRAEDDVLLGGATLSNVRRGVAQTCSLGYWMGAPFAGQGYMSAAVRTLLTFAFAELRLHRVEAACLPHNAASRRLLEKLGFQAEGCARRYLRIAGEWQDHLLFARLSSDPDVRREGGADIHEVRGTATAGDDTVWRPELPGAPARNETL
ncbi:GNAT family protein [Stappia sp.]|uniref:GNAT family N-acetyltransferase n=1 Tax=Stappia sp. TaxID=1870903 RepID=UPI0032D8E009